MHLSHVYKSFYTHFHWDKSVHRLKKIPAELGIYKPQRLACKPASLEKCYRILKVMNVTGDEDLL